MLSLSLLSLCPPVGISVWEMDEKDVGGRRRLEGREYAQMRGAWFACLEYFFGPFIIFQS